MYYIDSVLFLKDLDDNFLLTAKNFFILHYFNWGGGGSN